MQVNIVNVNFSLFNCGRTVIYPIPLMINPRLLILDEATEGLAPLVREEIWRGLDILKNKNLAILIVDKNIKPLIKIAQYHYILENGRVAWSGSTSELYSQPELQNRYLGV